MGISPAILTFASAVMGFSLWGRIRIARRLVDLTRRYEAAESQRSKLEQALASCEEEHEERMARLEHDLRSSISIIVGYASILTEQAESGRCPQPGLVLKSASAIQQSAQKSLRILEAAAEPEPAESRQAIAVQEGP
jgi:signal transduction histidine kinase